MFTTAKRIKYRFVKYISEIPESKTYDIKKFSFQRQQGYVLSSKKLNKFEYRVINLTPALSSERPNLIVEIKDLTYHVKGSITDYSRNLQFPLKKYQINLLKLANSVNNQFHELNSFTDIENLFVSIGTPDNFLFPWFYEDPAEVSKNLFEPVGKSKPRGKYYIDKEKTSKNEPQQQGLFGDTFEPEKKSGPTKAYNRINTGYSTTVKFQNEWDLLYPILMPPLDYDFSDDLVYGQLYDFQKIGVKFLLERKAALLADEMGTGKTVMSVVALRALFKKAIINKGLIACPASILNVWDEHLNDWAPDLSFTMVRGKKEIREMDWEYPAHLYVTTYDIIRNDFLSAGEEDSVISQDSVDNFDFVLLDEAQYIKNPISGRSKAVKRVNPAYRWELTGTPIENRIDDLVSLFDFLMPGYLNPKTEYTSSQIRKIIEPYFLRREKREVFKDLPKKVKENLWLELDHNQRREYDEIERSSIAELKEKGDKVSRIHIFAKLNKLKQICNFARNQNKSAKTDALTELVEIIKSNDEKVLIFSQYIEEGVNKLQEILKGFGVVTFKGGMTDLQRKNAVSKFRTDRDITIFLANVKTGGLGLTLTEANYVIHFDHWWNPSVMWQAEDRAHRKGQEKVVNVYSFWMKDTVEERIFTILKKKGLLFEDVVSGLSEQDIDSMISTEEWFEILGVKSKDERESMTENVRLRADTREIYDRLQKVDPNYFEEIVRRFFVKFGYLNAKLTKASYDRGIDIIASKQAVGGIEKIIVQCKRVEIVGANYARELYGVLSSKPETSKAFLVVSGRLSVECQRFCQSKANLVTIDGMSLAGYIKRYNINLD